MAKRDKREDRGIALKIRIDSDKFDRTTTSLLGTYALRVRGDSVEPGFPNGAIIIEPDEVPLRGKFVIDH
jgi:phage repressor protein C with HTH and peptisase S24 domain